MSDAPERSGGEPLAELLGRLIGRRCKRIERDNEANRSC